MSACLHVASRGHAAYIRASISRPGSSSTGRRVDFASCDAQRGLHTHVKMKAEAVVGCLARRLKALINSSLGDLHGEDGAVDPSMVLSYSASTALWLIRAMENSHN